MSTITTTIGPHEYKPGDVLHFTIPRPSWWRLISLWRWWRNPLRDGIYTVTSATSTTLEVRS